MKRVRDLVQGDVISQGDSILTIHSVKLTINGAMVMFMEGRHDGSQWEDWCNAKPDFEVSLI